MFSRLIPCTLLVAMSMSALGAIPRLPTTPSPISPAPTPARPATPLPIAPPAAAPAAPAIPGTLLTTFQGHTSSIQCTAVNSDGTLIASGASDRSLRLWDAKNNKEHATIPLPATCSSVAFSGDGTRVVAAAADQIFVIDTATGKILKSLRGPADANQVGISANGRIVQASGYIASVSRTDTYRNPWTTVWDISADKEKELLSAKSPAPRGGFSTDGNIVALMEPTGTVNLWNIKDNKPISTVHQNAGSIVAAAFSPDGKLFAAGNFNGGRAADAGDNTLHIWDVATGNERHALIGHEKGIYGLTFSSDAKKLWASDFNGDQKLWDVETGSLLARLERVSVDGKLQGMPVGQWAVSADFLHWASGSSTEVLWFDIKDFSRASAGMPTGATPVKHIIVKGQPTPRANTATAPARTAMRNQRHDGFVETAKKGDFDIVFEGDSITDWWQAPVNNQGGIEVFKKYFGNSKVANFAVSGDTTQGVLWGLQNGEGQGAPKAIMLLIGTNNAANGNTGPEIADGVAAIVAENRKDFPDAKILLMAIFPRGAGPTDPNRIKNEQANKIIAKLDDGKHVFFKNINDKFLTPQGSLIGFRSDNLHPTAEAYEIWAKEVADTLKDWVNPAAK